MTSPNKKSLKRTAMDHIQAVQDILQRWDPIGVEPGKFAPADEYDDYAPRIVSMLLQGCTQEQLGAHLAGIRLYTIGVEADPDRDWAIAGEILKAVRL